MILELYHLDGLLNGQRAINRYCNALQNVEGKMDKEYKCPKCERVLFSSLSTPRLSVISTRTFGEPLLDDILIEAATDFGCVCGTEVTIRDAIHYKRDIER